MVQARPDGRRRARIQLRQASVTQPPQSGDRRLAGRRREQRQVL
jgi:hypothetical protein